MVPEEEVEESKSVGDFISVKNGIYARAIGSRVGPLYYEGGLLYDEVRLLQHEVGLLQHEVGLLQHEVCLLQHEVGPRL